MESKFNKAFERARPHFKLFGNKMLVERLNSGEVKTKGGIILTESSNIRSDLKSHKPLICLVLAVGDGYVGDDGELVPLDIKPGNIVMLNSLGVSFFSVLPGSSSYSDMAIGLTSETDVQLIFENLEEYEAYAKALEEQEASK